MRDGERYPLLAADCIEAFVDRDIETDDRRLRARAGAWIIADALNALRRIGRGEGQ